MRPLHAIHQLGLASSQTSFGQQNDIPKFEASLYRAQSVNVSFPLIVRVLLVPPYEALSQGALR